MTDPRSEHELQSATFIWARKVLPAYNRRAFAVPNGQKLSGGVGSRSAQITALKAEGLETGVPDWQVPGLTPLGGFGGVAVEMKTARGVVKPDQWGWLLYYASIGWLAVVCRSDVEAINVLRGVGYVEP